MGAGGGLWGRFYLISAGGLQLVLRADASFLQGPCPTPLPEPSLKYPSTSCVRSLVLCSEGGENKSD